MWWISDDPALSRIARALIADPDNTIFVSPVSTWEFWLKNSLGKLDLPAEFGDALAKEEIEDLPLAVAHTWGLANLPWHHRDPFDRMLIAQAQAAGFDVPDGRCKARAIRQLCQDGVSVTWKVVK